MPYRLNTARTPAEFSAPSKPIAERVRDWINERYLCDQLVSRWQSMEHKLSLKAKVRGLSLDRALREPWPEIKVMDALMRRINEFDRRLPKSAEKIMRTRSSSASEAIAKLRLGIAMRCRSLGEDDAWALVEMAYAELCRLNEPLIEDPPA